MTERTLTDHGLSERPVLARLSRYWRVIATGISFTLFGLGGLVLGLLVYPCLRLVTRDPVVLQHRMQHLIHLSFGLFVEVMVKLHVMTYSVEGRERLNQPGQLIVANHPTLIDVVILISLMPRTSCIVKASLLRNPFTAGPVRSAGYVPNSESGPLMRKSQAVLDQGQSLVVFPEGTRTTPGEIPHLRRGTANIALAARRPIVPVKISCEPSTLTKGLPWYAVPQRRFHVSLQVGEPIDTCSFLRSSPNRSRAARALTHHMEELFWGARHDEFNGNSRDHDA